MQVGSCFIWGPQAITSITFIVQPALLRRKKFKIQELVAYCNYFKKKKNHNFLKIVPPEPWHL